MKQVNKNSLGFVAAVYVYESEAEADQAAGKQGALLEQANDNLYYRGAAPEVRACICETIETLTGIKRPVKPVMVTTTENGAEVTKQKKDSDGNEVWVFDQKEGDYIDLAEAKWEKENTGKKFVAEFQPFITEAIGKLNEGKGVSVDIKERERKAPQPKKLPQRYLDTATQMLSPGGKIELFAKDYNKLFGKQPDSSTAEALGWELKALVDENAKRASGKYGA